MAEKTMGFKDIRSGDLLAWSTDQYSAKGDFTLAFVRAMTRSKWGHVGVAWKVRDDLSEELMVVEATIPRIRVDRLTGRTNFYVIPMNMDMSLDGKKFLTDHLGLPYSMMDAVRAGLGLTLSHDLKYQCAEFAREFYLVEGIDLGKRQTPKSIVNNAVRTRGSDIYRVIK